MLESADGQASGIVTDASLLAYAMNAKGRIEGRSENRTDGLNRLQVDRLGEGRRPPARAADPDLEVVAVPSDASFKVWSHGYPYRTVRWHFHPEYEIQLITATSGRYFVADHVGSFRPGHLVMMGPNLPHNWVSDVPKGEFVAERGLIVQFDAAFVANSMQAFPEMRRIGSLLDAASWGLEFDACTSEAAQPIMRELLGAQGLRRLTLFLSLLDLLTHAHAPTRLSSMPYPGDDAQPQQTRINHALAYIGKHLSQPLREADLAQIAGQSVTAFSRCFRKHTGLPFVQYVIRLRLNLACQLLISSDASVADICFQAGFNNLSNFNRQFLVLKGMAPSRWRAEQHRIEDGLRTEALPLRAALPSLPVSGEAATTLSALPSSSSLTSSASSPSPRFASSLL